MARALIVGCGCRGRGLSAALIAAGYAVRATTRDESKLAAIQATGAEAVVADPDRLGTLMHQLAGVTVLCWLMGTAVGDSESVAALHGLRLRSLLEALVDTPVRGVVYEGAGSVPPAWLERGADIARRTSATFRMPIEILTCDPGAHDAWLGHSAAAVERALAS